jgi:Ca2+-binding EF-hand superfamily protein
MIYLYNRFDKDNDNKISLNEFLSELTNNNNN